jgi:hypothetical protein
MPASGFRTKTATTLLQREGVPLKHGATRLYRGLPLGLGLKQELIKLYEIPLKPFIRL